MSFDSNSSKEYEMSTGFLEAEARWDDDDEDISLDDLLRNKIDRIMALEMENKEKDKELAKLREDIAESEVGRKREIYVLRLDLDTCSREKIAAEERLGELHQDFQHMIEPENKGLDIEAEENLYKYKTAISAFENQVQMIKTSSGEVIRTMKEEISDLMDDKSRVELELLNQLASLDTEKKELEADLTKRIAEKDVTIELLQKRGIMDGHSLYSGDIDELENEISTLLLEKKNLENSLVQEQERADEEIKHLEHSNAILEQKLQALVVDVAVLRSGNDGSKKLKETITKREEELASFIDSVAQIRKQTNLSIENLDSVLNKATPDSEAEMDDDTEMVLSTLESASLIHDQLKVSIHLIELQLQNRLKALRNEKFGIKTAPTNVSIVHKMKEIQEQTMEATSKVEAKLLKQIDGFEKKVLDEAKTLKLITQNRTKSLEQMKSDNQELLQEIDKLKTSLEVESAVDEKVSETDAVQVSKAILNQLQSEIMRVVESVKVKNEAIKALSGQLYHQRLREKELRLQLRRVSAYPESPEKVTATEKRFEASSNKSTTKKSSSPSQVADEGKVDETGTRTMSIAPIRPSRREVYSPQFKKKKDSSI